MGIEIERKFLLKNDTWRSLARGTKYRQGYLNSTKDRTVRVRTIDDSGFLTVKGPNKGATRVEYEYDIPESDASNMLNDLCEKPIIEKNRYKIDFAGLVWDRFGARCSGRTIWRFTADGYDGAVAVFPHHHR